MLDMLILFIVDFWVAVGMWNCNILTPGEVADLGSLSMMVAVGCMIIGMWVLTIALDVPFIKKIEFFLATFILCFVVYGFGIPTSIDYHILLHPIAYPELIINALIGFYEGIKPGTKD